MKKTINARKRILKNKVGSALLNIFMLCVCWNTFLYLGLNFTLVSYPSDDNAIKLQGDFFDLYLNNKKQFDDDLSVWAINLRNNNEVVGGIEIEPNSNWTSLPSQEAGQAIGTSTNIFLDGLKIIYAFIATLFNIIMLPITLLSTSILPPLLVLMVGFPVSAVSTIVIIGFVGGRILGG